MAVQPRLKSVDVQNFGSQVVIWPGGQRRVYVDDPTGSVAVLLEILQAGEHETSRLGQAMAERGFVVTDQEVDGALSALDDLGVLEQAGGDDVLDAATRDRHHSNLRYYDIFSRLGRTSASFHQQVQRAKVLLLGAGGVGSGVLQSLVGLGVGEVTIVDIDVVERKNLARQFVYSQRAIGQAKVTAAHDWAAAYSDGTRVMPVHQRITGLDQIIELGQGADVIVGAIDSPADLYSILNEASFALGIPHVVGGLQHSVLFYWSIDPGKTPCRLCLQLRRAQEAMPTVLRQDPFITRTLVNRATGPMVQLISGLMSMEVMRYLTRTDPPVAGATYQTIDLAGGMAAASTSWQRHPDCPLCPREITA